MRKSFKKVLCAVMAASMVFSTPIATNVVAQAASGEEGACVVKDLTKTTELITMMRLLQQQIVLTGHHG